MRRRARHVVRLGIGRDLRASLRTRPIFRGSNQRSANARSSGRRFDVPPFHERDAIRLATLVHGQIESSTKPIASSSNAITTSSGSRTWAAKKRSISYP